MFRTVVVGVDGHRGGHDALALAGQLLGQGGKLTLSAPICWWWAPLDEGSSGGADRRRHPRGESARGRAPSSPIGMPGDLGDLFTGKGTAIVTNVPGPTKVLYVAGVPMRGVLVWAPTSGHIGMSVSLFSYRGEVTVGLMVDAALIPDPDQVITQLERELDALGRLKRVASRRRRAVTPASSAAG
jgi:hypothetical protein